MTIPALRFMRAFHERYREAMMIFLGVFWTAAALFLIVIALIVFAEQSDRNSQRRREARTVRTACLRSQKFGPPLIDFLEKAEGRLHLGPLSQTVEVEGKPERVIAYYRSTIPVSCPPR